MLDRLKNMNVAWQLAGLLVLAMVVVTAVDAGAWLVLFLIACAVMMGGMMLMMGGMGRGKQK